MQTSQEHFTTIVYAKFEGQTGCIMGNWKIENEAFRKRWRHYNQVICLPESSSSTNPKWRLKWWLPCWFRHVGSTKTLLCACSRLHSSVSAACDCCFFKFLRRSVDGKHFIRFLVWTKTIWCVFKVKPPFSNSSGVLWTRPLELTCRKSLAWMLAFLEFGPGTSNFGHSCPTVNIVFTSRIQYLNKW